jgi:hypothetical protein
MAKLSDLEPMTLARSLNRMESDRWLEGRNDPLLRKQLFGADIC